LDAVVLKALAKEANDRYQTGEELVKALEQALRAGPVAAPVVVPIVPPAPSAYALPPIPAAVAVPTVKTVEPAPAVVKKRRSRKPLAILLLLLLLLLGGGAVALSRSGSIGLGPLAAIFNPATNTPTLAATNPLAAGEIDQASTPVKPSETAARDTVTRAAATQPATPTSTGTVRPATATRTPKPTQTLRPTVTVAPTRTPQLTASSAVSATATSTLAPVAVVQTLIPLKPTVYQVFMPVILRNYRTRR
jgi:serine/threonine-protein kinase